MHVGTVGQFKFEGLVFKALIIIWIMMDISKRSKNLALKVSRGKAICKTKNLIRIRKQK